jgi:uncharacterized protein YsxB (DUF464 family)
MIEVVILRTTDQQFSKVTISGHANSAPHGKDLVCAAVSAVGVGCLNALGQSRNVHVINQEGLIDIQVLQALSNEETIILKTMVIQLRTIQDSYSKFIKIIERKEK